MKLKACAISLVLVACTPKETLYEVTCTKFGDIVYTGQTTTFDVHNEGIHFTDTNGQLVSLDDVKCILARIK